VPRLEEYLELAKSLSLHYQLASAAGKRELVMLTTSNRLVDGKDIEIALDPVLSEIANRLKDDAGTPCEDYHRTSKRLVERLIERLAGRAGKNK
jgi:hypothetical protein